MMNVCGCRDYVVCCFVDGALLIFVTGAYLLSNVWLFFFKLKYNYFKLWVFRVLLETNLNIKKFLFLGCIHAFSDLYME